MFRMLRNLYKEFASFGKPELEKLREETKQLQEQLIQLKAARAERERQQEVLAIAKLRATMEQMRQMDAVTQAAEAQVKNLVEDLGESAKPRMQAAIAAEVQEKAQAAMKQLDVDEVLGSAASSTSPVEPNTGGTAGNGAAPQRAAQSPVADAAVRDGATQFHEMQKRAQKFRGNSSGGDVGSATPAGHPQQGSSRGGYSEPK